MATNVSHRRRGGRNRQAQAHARLRKARMARATQEHLWLEPVRRERLRDPWRIDERTRERGRRGVSRARRALDHREAKQLCLPGMG